MVESGDRMGQVFKDLIGTDELLVLPTSLVAILVLCLILLGSHDLYSPTFGSIILCNP